MSSSGRLGWPRRARHHYKVGSRHAGAALSSQHRATSQGTGRLCTSDTARAGAPPEPLGVGSCHGSHRKLTSAPGFPDTATPLPAAAACRADPRLGQRPVCLHHPGSADSDIQVPVPVEATFPQGDTDIITVQTDGGTPEGSWCTEKGAGAAVSGGVDSRDWVTRLQDSRPQGTESVPELALQTDFQKPAQRLHRGAFC